MNTYQVEYWNAERWNAGMIIKMEPEHVRFYMQFLAGERPLVRIEDGKVHRINRDLKKLPPTRVRAVDPDWSQVESYYEFDGMSLNLVRLDRTTARLVRRPRFKL